MKTKYPLLNTMLEDMQNQNKLYKPTSFWEYGSSLLIDELNQNNVKNFRSFKQARGFFAPGYTALDYLENPEKYQHLIDELNNITEDKRFTTRVQRLFNGYTSAFCDYRVLNGSNIDKAPYVDKVSESKVGNPIEQVEFDGRNFSRSFLNYLLGLNFLKQNIDTSDIRTVMEIGGGFGTLGEVLLGDKRNDIFYINMDIPPVAYYSSYYLQEVFGSKNIGTYDILRDKDILDIKELKQNYKAINTCSWEIEKLQGSIDLFVNFISFQEMEPDVVQNYCKHIDRLQPKYILLRNMLEGKRKRSDDYLAGVEEPILGENYDKFLPNYKLLASDSSIFGFITEDGFHSQLRIYKRNVA